MNKHTIARAAVSAGLAVAMTLGSVAPATMAWAADGDSTITINNVDGNKTEFKGYKIFNADVVDNDNGGKTVSNIDWANDDVKAAVVDVIKAQEKAKGNEYKSTNAQDAAEWIRDHVTDTTKETAVASDSAAEAIAKAVMGKTEQTTVTGGQQSDALKSGYWLFVTDPSTVDNDSGTKNTETYTSPIFAVVGGSAYTVTEKASVPTVEKKIVSDKDGLEYDAADSHVGQDVTYNIYGTVAQDFATYDSYSYVFTDNVTEGLTVESGSVKVYMYASKDAAKADLTHTEGTDVTSNFTTVLGVAKDDGSKDLTVTAKTTDGAKGLKSINGATKDSCFVVTYTAKINSKAVIGNPGNPNTVTLTYSNNPNAEGTGETVPDTVRDFTYALNLVKLDQGTEKALDGATFTIKVKSVDDKDKSSVGKYVKADGTLTDNVDEAKLTTKDGAAINVKGLDYGTYTVTEESAPTGYTKVAPFDFTIDPTIDETSQEVTKLESTLDTKDADHVKAGLVDPNSTKGDNVLTMQANSGVTDNNTVNITVGDVKSVGLPLTGQAGIGVTLAAGGAVLAIGVYRVVRSRREQDAE
ncbi:isopeptide-forming domain-containing fimbrial protein [Parafannyhessea umbonata]|jgi:fimbrial isopeptide formation D2 family protein|uniref:Isopeptide-forming domain-containing fimbrial protein n=1 Tax=Parafannyhessea umbonata TaxID=604330 RepID=A0A6N7X5F7_9ACTN|nr:isopeptide-forming domain-containing fimbrial protein [Parafannyhessea umbonata]MST59472.1 isopeptide-forming domain-containing fimbrial protein [Parafannyhessea umbonata]